MAETDHEYGYGEIAHLDEDVQRLEELLRSMDRILDMEVQDRKKAGSIRKTVGLKKDEPLNYHLVLLLQMLRHGQNDLAGDAKTFISTVISMIRTKSDIKGSINDSYVRHMRYRLEKNRKGQDGQDDVFGHIGKQLESIHHSVTHPERNRTLKEICMQKEKDMNREMGLQDKEENMGDDGT